MFAELKQVFGSLNKFDDGGVLAERGLFTTLANGNTSTIKSILPSISNDLPGNCR